MLPASEFHDTASAQQPHLTAHPPGTSLMLRVTFFAIPNQMEIKRTEVHYFVRKPRWENNEFTRSIAANSGHSNAELDIRSGTLAQIVGHTHLEKYRYLERPGVFQQAALRTRERFPLAYPLPPSEFRVAT